MTNPTPNAPMTSPLHKLVAVSFAAIIIGACGGPKQYVQVERPTACQGGTQPAIVEFKFDRSGSIDTDQPIWECLPSCGADKEYVSLVRMGPSVRPQCMDICKAGWARKYVNFPKPGMHFSGSAANCEIVDGLDCYPVSEEAKAKYAKDHQDCVKTEEGVAASNEVKGQKTLCVARCTGKRQDCEANCKLRFGPMVSSSPQCWQACTDEMKSCASTCQ